MGRRTLDQWDPARRLYLHTDEDGRRRYEYLTSESYADFQVKGRSLGEVGDACAGVAKDLGLVGLKGRSQTLLFRDPFLLPLFPVEVSVTRTDRATHVDVSVVGASRGGEMAAQRYAERLVRSFCERLARETSFSWTPPAKQTRRQHVRGLLASLRLLQ